MTLNIDAGGFPGHDGGRWAPVSSNVVATWPK